MLLYQRYRYSQWDGTQQIFDADASDIMDAISGDLLQHGDLARALRDLFRNGMPNRDGEQSPNLRQLMERLKQQRRQQLQQSNLDSVVDDLKERMESILRAERQGIRQRLDEADAQPEPPDAAGKEQQRSLKQLLRQRAQRNLDRLDDLPDSLGGQIQGLMDYDFMDPDARQQFQELLDLLQKQMAQNISQQMRDQMQNMTPEQMQAMRQMMQELNQMLRDRLEGRTPDFDGFMQRWGAMFGDDPPRNLDELMERIRQQMAQMQSLMDSLSPDLRQELEDALQSALDPRLQDEMAEFASLMRELLPPDELARQYPFLGDDNMTLEQALDAMREMQALDHLEEALQRAMRTGNLDDVDPEQLAELLGEDARRAWQELDRLRQMLKDAGYIDGDDNMSLTARGIRRIGQKAMREVFQRLKKDRMGNHDLNTRGAGGDLLGETKPYEFGDPLQLDLQATVKNAIVRGGPQVPVRLRPDDFEIYRNEQMTRAATIVLLDQSRSMGMFNNWVAAKRVTLALFALIRQQYPRDTLHVVGFSDYARELPEEDLAGLTWNNWVSGTNLHHALMLARRLLSREKGGSRQIMVITDGEPTAHLEGQQAYFSYPPSHRTEVETFKEVRRCTQEGIVINTFMLENNYQLVNFVDRMTRINRGRAFYSSSENLGEYVLVDYITNRRKRIGG